MVIGNGFTFPQDILWEEEKRNKKRNK